MIKTAISILAEGFENKSLSKQFSFSLLRVEILAGLTVAIALVPEAVAFAFVAGVEPCGILFRVVREPIWVCFGTVLEPF